MYLLADPLRVQQVLINLLANAAKYTPPGGSIRLDVEARGEDVVIEVRDNGIGMTPSVRECVFGLFTRGTESDPSSEYTGLGVGLALVKSLVEGHGGTVQACSDGLGAGSCFVVRLPVVGGHRATRKTLTSVAQRIAASVEHHAVDSPMLDA